MYSDAYAAALANPLPEQALNNLRHLVQELCEHRQLQVLATLPFAGTLVKINRQTQQPEVISLADQVVSVLARRACSADLHSSPQPYQVCCCYPAPWESKAAISPLFAHPRRQQNSPSVLISSVAG